jgi:hypothetical protein
MPERVTQEERQISLLIEKARSAKEILLASLDSSRNPIDDDSEVVKLKRPKAENYEPKFVSNDGPAANHAYAGDVFKKAIAILKAINESDYRDNPEWNEEASERLESELTAAHTQMSKIIEGIKAGKGNLFSQLGGLVSTLETMQREIKDTNPDTTAERYFPETQP